MRLCYDDKVAATHNLLVVSDLHFGEDLLPGISEERRRTVDVGARTFCEFLRYHQPRRLNGRPWRLVVAGDLLDFMSMRIDVVGSVTPRTRDEVAWGLGRYGAVSVARMQAIGRKHAAVLKALVQFVEAGHLVDIIVGNHDIELLEPEVQAAWHAALAAQGASADVSARCVIVPWFVHLPGVVWIEHGHAYDEACAFEYPLAPLYGDVFMLNVDYAAVRYLATTAPELDAHGAEQWSILGYLRYASGHGGVWPFCRSYWYFARALFAARRMQRAVGSRAQRRAIHQARVRACADAAGLPSDVVFAIDRLARAPLTLSLRRMFSMLALDVFAVALGIVAVAGVLATVTWWLPLVWFVALGVAQGWLRRALAGHVASQLPMRRVPSRIRALVGTPTVILGHTHDALDRVLPDGTRYINCGTWLPAARPGLLRSFTFVRIVPDTPNGIELLQWKDAKIAAWHVEPPA